MAIPSSQYDLSLHALQSQRHMGRPAFMHDSVNLGTLAPIRSRSGAHLQSLARMTRWWPAAMSTTLRSAHVQSSLRARAPRARSYSPSSLINLLRA